MPPSRVPSQQLQPPPHRSGSPTTTTTTTSSVRRNLFSAHLSRRPASGSQSSSQGSTSQQHSHSNPHSQIQPAPPIHSGVAGQEQELSNHRVPRTTYATAVPPTVSQIHAASRRYQHQRSVSTPSLSPSPPRLSPFHNLPPAVTLAHSVATGPAQLPFAPTPPRHMTAAAESYDPRISPNRPLSPRSRETLFPNSSVIALNPVTGRPILPHLPVLPGRLRLTDEGDGAQQGGHDDEGGDEDHEGAGASQSPDGGFHRSHQLTYTEQDHSDTADAHGGAQPQHFFIQSRIHAEHPSYRLQHHQHRHHQHVPSDPDMDHAHQSPAAMMRAAAEDEASLEADEERRDRERIERLLREMMARQRARAKVNTNKISSSTVGDGPPSSSSAAMVSSGVKKRGTLRQHHLAASQRRRHIDMEDDDNDGEDVYAAADADSEESEAEREELMSLITASLRREVVRAEDEGWMFGDSGMGMGMGWHGREEGLIGGYD